MSVEFPLEIGVLTQDSATLKTSPYYLAQTRNIRLTCDCAGADNVNSGDAEGSSLPHTEMVANKMETSKGTPSCSFMHTALLAILLPAQDLPLLP